MLILKIKVINNYSFEHAFECFLKFNAQGSKLNNKKIAPKKIIIFKKKNFNFFELGI